MAKQEKKQNDVQEETIDRSKWKKQSSDVVGHWDGKGELLCVPHAAKIFDGSIEASKPSTLIIVELLAPCGITMGSQKKGTFKTGTAKKGDQVGVWYKPGMKAIVNLCDAPCSIIQSGERDIGKPEPMKLYEIASPGPYKRLLLLEDAREESASAKTALDSRGSRRSTRQVDDLDELPF